MIEVTFDFSHINYEKATALTVAFFLGGFGITETDPGIGIYLVPLGALFLCIAVYLVAQNSLGHSRIPDSTINSAEPNDSALNQSDT